MDISQTHSPELTASPQVASPLDAPRKLIVQALTPKKAAQLLDGHAIVAALDAETHIDTVDDGAASPPMSARSPSVQAALMRAYPDDDATGARVGPMAVLRAQLAGSRGPPSDVRNILNVHPGVMLPVLTSMTVSAVTTTLHVGSFAIVNRLQWSVGAATCDAAPTFFGGGALGLLGSAGVFTEFKLDRDAKRIGDACVNAVLRSAAVASVGVTVCALMVDTAHDQGLCSLPLLGQFGPIVLMVYTGVAAGVGAAGVAVYGAYRSGRHVYDFIHHTRAHEAQAHMPV